METLYEVTYRTELGKSQYVQVFKDEQKAIAFMFAIETSGGISVMQRIRKKIETNTEYTYKNAQNQKDQL